MFSIIAVTFDETRETLKSLKTKKISRMYTLKENKSCVYQRLGIEEILFEIFFPEKQRDTCDFKIHFNNTAEVDVVGWIAGRVGLSVGR